MGIGGAASADSEQLPVYHQRTHRCKSERSNGAGNNVLGFLKSEGYFEIRQGAKCKSTDFYKVYERWCLDNLEKPLAASTFIHHLKDNQKSLGIVYDDKCIGTNRGFHNVDVDLFLPIDVPSPWD